MNMSGSESMGNDDRVFADEAALALQHDLRQQIAAAVLDRADLISADAVAIFPYSGLETLDADYCGRLGHFLTRLLAFAVRDARVDSRGGFVADLHRIVLERMLPMDQLFTFVYFTERADAGRAGARRRPRRDQRALAARRANRPPRLVRPPGRLRRARPARTDATPRSSTS